MSKLVDSIKNLPERLCPECKKKGLAIIKKGNRKGSMYWCPGCEKVKEANNVRDNKETSAV